MDLSSGMTVQLLIETAVMVLVIWFRARRARPTLSSLRAEQLAWLGLIATFHRDATGSPSPGADR